MAPPPLYDGDKEDASLSDTPLDARLVEVNPLDTFPTIYPNRYGGRRHCIFADVHEEGFKSDGEGEWTLEEEKAHLVAENERLIKICDDLRDGTLQRDRERGQRVVGGSSKECIVVATFASDKWFLLPDNATRWEVTKRGLSYSQPLKTKRRTAVAFHDQGGVVLKPTTTNVYHEELEEEVIAMLARDATARVKASPSGEEVSELEHQVQEARQEIKALTVDEKREPNTLRGDFGQAKQGGLLMTQKRYEDWFFVPFDADDWAIEHRMLIYTNTSGDEVKRRPDFSCTFLGDRKDGLRVATIKLEKSIKEDKELHDLIRSQALLPTKADQKRREMRQCEERSDEAEPYIKIGVKGENRLLRIANAALRKEWKILRGGDEDAGNGNIAVAAHDYLTIYEIPSGAETWKIEHAKSVASDYVVFEDRGGKTIDVVPAFDDCWSGLHLPFSWIDVPSVIAMVRVQEGVRDER